MFCVNCSRSMDSTTGFKSDYAPEPAVPEPRPVIDVSAYAQATLEITRNSLCQHESFAEIVATVTEASAHYRKQVASRMLTVISTLLHEELQPLAEKIQRVDARLCNHNRHVLEEALVDFLVFCASTETLPKESWIWNVGDLLSGQSTRKRIAKLPNEITDIPHDFRCPVSYEILQDPVIAADGQTYSQKTMIHWFRIAKSSPSTGRALSNTELQPDHGLADRVNGWVKGEDITSSLESVVTRSAKRRRTSSDDSIVVTLTSQFDTFTRSLTNATTATDLYKLAFRGMKGCHFRFGLSIQNVPFEPSEHTVGTLGVTNGARIRIDIENVGRSPHLGDSDQNCLAKIYDDYDQVLFSYWVSKKTTVSLSSVIINHWRYALKNKPDKPFIELQVWANIAEAGDSHHVGMSQASSVPLADLLTCEYASGTLEAEAVYSPEDSHNTTDTDEESEMAEEFDGGWGEEVSIAKPLLLRLLIQEKKTEPEHTKLSRLDLSKQMLEALINRILTYSYSTHVGLITFDSEAKVSQAMTHVVENFRRSVERMNASGDTALWDALNLANDQIDQYAVKYPTARKRIICLSDGDDTKSSKHAHDVYWKLRQNNVVVDSIFIGDEISEELKALSISLGSYCFKPDSMATALTICELDPVLSQMERPDIRQAPFRANSTLWDHFDHALWATHYTQVPKDVYPARKEHPNLKDNFVHLAATVRRDNASATRGTLRISRLMTEMRSIADQRHPKYDCYVSEADISFWKIVMEGVSTSLVRSYSAQNIC